MADNNTNTVINTNTVRMTEKQKVKEITDRLEEGLKELFESEKYKSAVRPVRTGLRRKTCSC